MHSVSHTLLKIAQARFCGSPHHPIAPFKAAISVVHIILTPLVFLTLLEDHQPVRIGVQFQAQRTDENATRWRQWRPNRDA
jgi:hypothetical protein